MQRWWLVLAASAVASCSARWPTAPRPESVTVALEFADTSTSCGGVIIGPSRVITARHCVTDNPEQVTVIDTDGERFLGVTEPQSDDAELALIRTRERFTETASIRNQPVTQADVVRALYHTGSSRWRVETARVIDPAWLQWLLLEYRFQRGASGSGIWDTQGRLVGILTRHRNGMTEAVLAKEIARLLARLERAPAEVHAAADTIPGG